MSQPVDTVPLVPPQSHSASPLASPLAPLVIPLVPPSPVSICLPGYECQLYESGLEHSQIKLQKSADDLALATTERNNNSVSTATVTSAVKAARKARSATTTKIQLVDQSKIILIPCQSDEDTLSYRCSCSFQMIPLSNDDDDDMDDDDEDRIILLQYAMRKAKTPIPLKGDYFPI